MRRLPVLLACLWLGHGSGLLAGEKPDITISGTISVPQSLEAEIAEGNRLVIKMYFPKDGVEHDLKYWILDTFAFPQDFNIAPTVNMAGMTRGSAYLIEIYTDRDRNVLNLIDGEFWAQTDGLFPLGTKGLQIELGRPSVQTN